MLKKKTLFNYFLDIFYSQHITFAKLLQLSDIIISEKQGHLILKSLLTELKTSMGPSFVKSKWQESALELKQWMNEDQVNIMYSHK